MRYLKTNDRLYDFNKIYYINFNNFIYRLITDRKTLKGYLFYCDGTNYDSCEINYDDMTVTYKNTLLDILEAEVSSEIFRFLGEVESVDKLPTNANNGDIYQVGDKEYVWNGESWTILGFNVDLSTYTTKEYVDNKDKMNADNIILNSTAISANETLITQEISDRKADISKLTNSLNICKTFTITLVEKGDGTYTANKSFTEISTAYENEQTLVVKVGNGVLPLLNAEVNDTGAGFTFGYTQVGTDGDYITTRSIHYLHTYAVGDIEERDEWTEYTQVEEYLKTTGGILSGNISMGANSIVDIQKLHIDGQAPLYIGQVIEKNVSNKPRLTGVVNSNAAAFVKSDSQSEYVPLFVSTPTDNNHAATKQYVDNAIESSRMEVDNALSNNSTNPVQNKIIDSALKDKQSKFGTINTVDNETSLTLDDSLKSIITGDYSIQTGNSTFAITNTVTNKYLTFDNDGALSLKDGNGPITPTDPADLVTKKYVDEKTSTTFAYDSATKTLTISV